MAASVDQAVSLFTTALKLEFLQAYEAASTPIQFEKFTTVVPSTTTIEHHPFMGPPPGMSVFTGHRYYAQIAAKLYSVKNETFSNAFQVPLDHILDDQTGGYKIKARELAELAKVYQSIRISQKLGTAKVDLCYDDSPFIGDTHNLGTVDNLLTFNAASNDTLTYKLFALYFGSTLKPMGWQHREGPDFQSNAGDFKSMEERLVKYFCTMRGEAFYGYPWNAVEVDITDTPNLTEMHTIFQNIETAFRGFVLPKSLATDDGQYPHAFTVFSSANLMLVGSVGLAALLRQALNLEFTPIGGTTITGANSNPFRGWADWTVSPYI
jgi:phage major head subunit gpT-like protein